MKMSPDLQFSYSQFFVYDAELVRRACEWTERHFKQGFARRDRAVSVGTLLEFGSAEVTVELGAPTDLQSYERALAVPLRVQSQAVAIDGPEENAGARRVAVSMDHHRLTVAQRVIDDLREEIKIWLQKLDVPLARSELLIVDDGLDPAHPLLETAKQP